MQDSISYVTMGMFLLFLECRTQVGGCLGGGLRRASVCPIDCTVGVVVLGAAADEFATTSPSGAWVLTQEGLSSGSPGPWVPRPWPVPSD